MNAGAGSRAPCINSRQPYHWLGTRHTHGLVAWRDPQVYTSLMGETSFRVVPQKDRQISVEMVKANGQRRLIPDFRDEAEAKAWIVQIQRIMQATNPRLPGAKREPA